MSGWYGNIQIYYEPGQPLTRYVDTNIPEDMDNVLTNSPRKLFWCANCGRRRRAENLNIAVYYDHDHIFCNKKEYGRSSEFPFGYTRVCKGTSWFPPAEKAA